MMANVDTICDIQKVILNSVEFANIKVNMLEKVKIDFKSAQNYVNDNYEKCRNIFDFQNTWD